MFARHLALKSPLTQGRGSKHLVVRLRRHGVNGRPSHRGVDRNPRNPGCRPANIASPLTQGRGSKHGYRDPRPDDREVAPHTGAWIETDCSKISTPSIRESPLTQGRGSKRCNTTGPVIFLASPLTQGRGSKHYVHSLASNTIESPLTQGRGSKLRNVGLPQHGRVAPHTGAWIETGYLRMHQPRGSSVAPHTGAWIETVTMSQVDGLFESPLTQGRGSKHQD